MPKVKNQRVSGASKYEVTRGIGQTRMLINALDYKKTANPLTCTIDAGNIKKLAEVCRVSDLQVMLNEECTKESVEKKIKDIGSRCTSEDVFVYYYSGHGTNILDKSGDEADGKDEAFCFVTPDGQISLESCMIDDDFAKIITTAIPQECLVVVLTDCCHSGTMCDFDNAEWKGRSAVSIAGCLDSQTSGDIGKGGIFSHSMLLAIEKLLRAGDTHFSVGKLFNATLHEDDTIFNSAQDITMQWSDSVKPEAVKWPLVPVDSFKAPLSQAIMAAAGSAGQSEGKDETSLGADDLKKVLESTLTELGLSPGVVQNITGANITKLAADYAAMHGADAETKSNMMQFVLGFAVVVIAILVATRLK